MGRSQAWCGAGPVDAFDRRRQADRHAGAEARDERAEAVAQELGEADYEIDVLQTIIDVGTKNTISNNRIIPIFGERLCSSTPGGNRRRSC